MTYPMHPTTDGIAQPAMHYAIDTSACPAQAWRAVAAHHLLTSRHLPEATMSVVGIDDRTARGLRIYAVELGLSGLRIPDRGPISKSPLMRLTDDEDPRTEPALSGWYEMPSRTSPSVLCEALVVLLEAVRSSQ